MSEIKTDLDLAPAFRTQANLWMAKYFQSLNDLAAANRGIRRLQRRLEAAKSRNKPQFIAKPDPDA